MGVGKGRGVVVVASRNLSPAALPRNPERKPKGDQKKAKRMTLLALTRQADRSKRDGRRKGRRRKRVLRGQSQEQQVKQKTSLVKVNRIPTSIIILV